MKGGWGTAEAVGGNVVHELAQSVVQYPDNGWGTSWQDYTLSGAGMYIGGMITTGSITPYDLAGVIKDTVGPNGPGSMGFFQMFNYVLGPLAGQRLS